MRHRPWLLLIAAICLPAPPAPAQAEPASEAVAPGPQYQAGWLTRIVLGAQWRDVWTTPVSAPVLDLTTFDGGIRLVRRGGGMQIKNLRLESVRGNVWVFRSIDKDPERILDPDTAKSAIGTILQDLTSTEHPLAPLVVAPLLETAGVIHATPFLGGGLWLALFASGMAFEIASSVNATVVRSDEGTSFYFTSGFGL